MAIIKQTIPTSNYDTSRKPITHIVIHWIVGTLASADASFKNPSRIASAHYGVEDNTIYQWVDEKHTAYHCGNYAFNQKSIGIEHSAAPDRPASEATYQSSGKLIAEIAKRYNIPLDRTHILGHKEVSPTQCPGTMNIDKLIAIAKGSPIPTPVPPSNTESKAAVKFDQALIYLHSISVLPTPRREDYIDNNVFIEKLKAHITYLEEIKRKYEALVAQPPYNPQILKDKIINFIKAL